MKKTDKMITEKRSHRRCLRCGHEWYTRKLKITVCANKDCHTPYWNTPRKQKNRNE